jgi:hypothetical protein
MIHPDRRDDGDIGPDQVRRVPGPAHPHLEDRQGDRLVGEPQIGEAGRGLEVRERPLTQPVDELEVRLEVLPFGGELRFADRLAADLEALGHRKEMGRREDPGREALGTSNRGRHARSRGLPVRPGDVDRRIRQLRMVKVVDQLPDPIQRRSGHVLRLPRVQTREGVLEPHQRSPRARARRRELTRGRARRGPLRRIARCLPAPPRVRAS